MVDPFRILTRHYDSICLNLGCAERRGMTGQQAIRTAALGSARIVFLVLCSGFVGASLSMLLHGQINTLPERMAKQETQAVLEAVEVTGLRNEVMHLEEQVATMNGIGIGLGSALGLLQILQMVLGRKSP